MAKNQVSDNQKTPEPIKETAPDVVNNLEITCFEIATEYINNLDDPSEIKENNGLFVDMLKYIYNNYLGVIIGNINDTYIHYDYDLLDKIFSIYSSLVYKYKQNKRCSILEFSLFTHVDRHTLHNAVVGNTKKLSVREIANIKRWYTECENTLTNGNGVFEIFLLKSQYRYNDNLSPIPVSDQGPALSVQELPDLAGLHNAITDKKSGDNT